MDSKVHPTELSAVCGRKVTDMATIGAEQLRNKYKGDSIAIAEAWILGHLDYSEDYFVRECVNVIDVAAARARMELRVAGHAVPPAPVKL